MPARLIKGDQIEMTHRGGPPGIGRVGRAISSDLSPTMAAGFAEFDDCAIAWTVHYDEIVYVIEGEFTLTTDDGLIDAKAGDVVWVPKGTRLEYGGKNARIFYAVQPGNWREAMEARQN